MEMNIHPVLPEELLYMWHRPSRDSGCIGCLTAHLQAHSPEFESSWLDCTPSLNTPEFTNDFNDMMDSLRQGILKSPSELCAYYTAHSDSLMQDNPSTDTRYGFRINTGRYSYLLVCSFSPSGCRIQVNAFSFLALDRYMREENYAVPGRTRRRHHRDR